MEFIKKIIVVAAFLSLGLNAVAQQGKAGATIDSNRILIGDQIHLRLTYDGPAKAGINWPIFKDTLSSKIEIVKQGKIDTTYNTDRSVIKLNQILTLTCFDSGSYNIPAIAFFHTMPGDTTKYTSSTAPLPLYVNTLQVDTTQAIKDIKAPLTSPLTLWEILPWVGGALLLAAIITLTIIFIIRKKKKKPIFGRVFMPVLPHIKALKALETLRLERLWQQGKNKEYYSKLTDIIRIYLDDRFEIPALEMITPEVIIAVESKKEIQENDRKLLEKMLSLADMVKFAKYIPLPDEHDYCLNISVEFVKNTSPILPPENNKGNQAAPESTFIENEINQQKKEDNL